jgi:hypothetical protein
MILAVISSVYPIAIAIFASITAPIFLNALNTRNASRERQLLWDREDGKAREAQAQRADDIERQNEVARKAERAADRLAVATAQASQKAEEARVALLHSNELVAKVALEQAHITDQKLDVIHRLVNSQLLVAMQAELDSTIRLSLVLKELTAVNRRSGIEPTRESVELLATADARIAELGVQISERERTAQAVERQIRQHPEAGITTSPIIERRAQWPTAPRTDPT